MMDWSQEGIGQLVKHSTAPIQAIVALGIICGLLIKFGGLVGMSQTIVVCVFALLCLAFVLLLAFKTEALVPKKEEKLLWQREQLGDSKSELLYVVSEKLPDKISPLIEGGKDKQ